MTTEKTLVVFVHGWSVINTDTYGGLPERLVAEAPARDLKIEITEVHLGKYVSFHDEVRVTDIARAFESAYRQQLAPLLKDGRRFVCITHSTGGPVIREWWKRYYDGGQGGLCPMSHLIMLAPANFGSALAQLGKGRLSRLKFWFGGREPGQGVLDWLELGSAKAWELNTDWIRSDGSQIGARGIFPCVLTGQSIDRAFYDNLNSYTGELGSDGVVRVSAANLNGRYIRLRQSEPKKTPQGWSAPTLEVEEYVQAPETALRILAGKSHSGQDMGIMRSVHRGGADPKSAATVDAIMACIKVRTKPQYTALCARFAEESRRVQEAELLEKEDRILRDRYFIHDRFSQVIFRVTDDRDYPVDDFDLVLTAGEKSSADHLPEGFFQDRQRNSKQRNVITYSFNHSVMKGTDPVPDPATGRVFRERIAGTTRLGLVVNPRPQAGFVHYLPCAFKATGELLERALVPNGTTLIDICLRRVVHSNVFDFEKAEDAPTKFDNVKPSGDLAR